MDNKKKYKVYIDASKTLAPLGPEDIITMENGNLYILTDDINALCERIFINMMDLIPEPTDEGHVIEYSVKIITPKYNVNEDCYEVIGTIKKGIIGIIDQNEAMRIKTERAFCINEENGTIEMIKGEMKNEN